MRKNNNLEPLIEAHDYSINNKSSLMNDDLCGCFHCLKIFNPTEITEWTDFGKTAICPYCDTDSIIGKSSKFSITKKFLNTMKEYWF